jgi:transcriptional regulator with XRE-family HTH domain
MSMRFTEIGQQLRAYRLESGLRAEEIAARLGVSRAALYRYEKGEVIKLDTIKRLAELLKISPLSLLGIGVEYYNRPIGYFERVRQIEETADQILQLFGPICYLTTSDAYDHALAAAFDEAAEQATSERTAMRSIAEQVLGILTARKRMYAIRRPGIIAMVSISSVQHLLETGMAGGIQVSDRIRRICRDVAVTEVENMAALMEAEPMGLQFGLLNGPEPSSAFKIIRARDRVSLAINGFRPDTHPSAHTGVAMITGADEAIAAHQRVAEATWRDALKGPAGANRLRQLVATAVPA